jgi:peptide/nickel transport system substrate-binding protein
MFTRILKSTSKQALYLFITIVLLAGCAGPAATQQPVATTVPTAAASTEASAATQPEATATGAQPAEATAATTDIAQTTPNSATDTLVFATNLSDLTTFDPAVMYAWSGILTVNNLYQTLVHFEGTDYSVVKPYLAEKWDIQDGDDGSTLTFTLKDGQKFASGNPITADDVVYSFQRVIALKKGPSFLFTDIAGLTDQSIKATDEKTVTISLPKSYSPQVFLSILTFTVGSVVDAKEVKAHEASGDYGSTWLLDHSAGSGPYILDHWTKEVEVLLKENTNYTGTKPIIPNVLIQHVLESTNQQFGLENGDIDIARSLSPEQIAALSGNPDVTTAKGNSQLLIYIGMNQKVKELTDAKVREALRAAVDYDGIVNGLLSGNALKVQTLIPNGLLGYNDDAPFQQNTDQAKQLLKEAGYESGLSLTLLAPTGNAPGGAAWSDIAAKLQSDYAKAGITIEIQQVPYTELYNAYRSGTFQLIIVEWGPDYSDPDGNINPFVNFNAQSIASRLGWNDAEISQKAHDAALIADTTERGSAYKDITEYVLHNGFEWKPNGWVDFSVISK